MVPWLAAPLAFAGDISGAAVPPSHFLPVGEVVPGMKGVALTVLSGSRIEELPVEILAVMENALGPDHHLIIGRLSGERAEFTGVAAGMSGSPVYVDGRLVGALSYRLGIFTKEPIAGITPIEYMLGLGTGKPVVATGPSHRPERGMPVDAVAAGSALRPIQTPLVVSGLAPSLMEELAPSLEGLGSLMVAGSAGSGPAPARGPIRPGDAIAAQLVRGDIGLAVSGTVTYVEGDRVLAFGHGLLQSGYNEFPMARAEVYTTLASEAGSSKFIRVLEPVGSWQDIRLTGSAGVTSRIPEMLPLRVSVDMPSVDRSFTYEVARHRDWTALLVAIAVAGSLANTPSFSNDSTITVTSRIALEGHDDVVFENLYTGLGRGGSVALATAADTQAIFGAVYQNRFEAPSVRSVEISAEGVEEGRITFVEGVWPSRTEAAPGDEIVYHVRLRSWRGVVETRTFTCEVPEQTPRGPLRVLVGGGNFLASAERGILARQISGAGSLDQIIAVVNGLRRGDALYAKALRPLAGAVVQSEVLPGLPPSILTTLGTNRGAGEVATMTEATLWEASLPTDAVVVGGVVLTLNIR